MENTASDQPSARLKTMGYRFALLLTGAPTAAVEIVRAVLADTADELAQLRRRARRRALVIRLVRDYALKWRETNPPGAVFGRVAVLPEPARSVLALFLCMDVSVEELELILRLRHTEFIQTLAEARKSLFPGSVFPEKPRLVEHRPWGGDRPTVAKSVARAGESPELTAQVKADTELHGELAALEVPKEILELVVAAPGRPRIRELAFQPAVLAILLAVVVVLGTVVYLAETRMGNFPGREVVEEIVEHVGLTGEYEPFPPTQAGKLDDWFLLKGFEGFNVPPQLEKATAVGGRVFRHDGVLLAEVELKTGNARLLVFHLADLKDGPLEPGRDWRVFQLDDWAVGVTRDGENGYIVLFEGDSDDMPAFLHSFGAAPGQPAEEKPEPSAPQGEQEEKAPGAP